MFRNLGRRGWTIPLVAVAAIAVMGAKGTGCSTGTPTATAVPAAADGGHIAPENPGCGLPAIDVNRHRSRAQVERYARRALACARRHHRHVYYRAPGDRVCLDADITPAGGVGIQSTPIVLSVAPGRTKTVPPVWIENTGSRTETMVPEIANDYPFCSFVLPPSWVSGTGHGITLGAGQAGDVTGLTVTVPPSALRGVYRSDVAVGESAGTVQGKANLGGSVAEEIEIEVS